jgi:hypothetical protein
MITGVINVAWEFDLGTSLDPTSTDSIELLQKQNEQTLSRNLPGAEIDKDLQENEEKLRRRRERT